MIDRPTAGSVAEYYLTYTDAIEEEDVLAVLRTELEPFLSLYEVATAEQLGFRYAESKWSMQEILGHLLDSERVFALRALCFARGDSTELPGFDENAYVAAAKFDATPIENLITQARSVRQSTISLFESLDAGALAQVGTANGSQMVVHAVPWVIAGHQRHHEVVVRSRYLRHE